MTDQTDYSSKWEDYRRRRLWFFGAWLGGFLIACLLGISLTALLSLRSAVCSDGGRVDTVFHRNFSSPQFIQVPPM